MTNVRNIMNFKILNDKNGGNDGFKFEFMELNENFNF